MDGTVSKRIAGAKMKRSKWQRDREKKKVKLRWPCTPRGWLTRWNKSLDVIGHKVYDLRDARDMYAAYSAIIFNNRQLDKRNEFLVLIQDMYLSYMLVMIRTLDDTDLRSHSLYNLIEEVLDHAEHLSKDWYVGQYRPQLRDIGRETYERDWGKGPYPSTSRIRNDLFRLKRDCGKARSIVNGYLAHTARRRCRTTLSYREMDAMVDSVCELWRKYCLLVHGTAWDRPAAHGWERIFERPLRGNRNE